MTQARFHLRTLFTWSSAVVIAACGGKDAPTEVGNGSLKVSITGLPSGGDVRISGPSNYSRFITHSTTLEGLRAGEYRVEARQVTSSDIFAASQPVQTVDVRGGSATVTVAYARISGSLAIGSSGAPEGSAQVTVRGPDGFSTDVFVPRTVSALLPGQYWVVPKPTFAGSCAFQTSDSVAATITVGQTANVTLTYAQPSYGGYNMCIESAYFVQAVQRRSGSIPLMRDRSALLRVLVRGNMPFAAFPTVRARFYEGGTLIHTELIQAPGPVSMTPDESNGASTWNVVVPGTLIRPSVSVLVDVDPGAQVIGEVERADNTFPRDGVPLPLDTRAAPPLRVRLVPIAQINSGHVTEDNKSDFLWVSAGLLPVSSIISEIAPALSTQAPEITANNSNGSWQAILQELEVRRLAESQPGQPQYHYVGVLRASYTSGIAGMAYVGGWTSLVWDHLQSRSASWVLAHELGHNWGRYHVPGCNQNPTGLDEAYPHGGGSIGVFGYDVRTGTIYTPAYGDIMSYCNSQWISDYNYLAIMQYRGFQPAAAAVTAVHGSEVMIVSGTVRDGRITLQPTFVTRAAPSLPQRPGRYRLEGLDAGGAALFSFSFEPVAVAHAEAGDAHFAFAVPLTGAARERLHTIHVVGRGARTSRGLGAGVALRALDEVTVSAASGGALDLRWDASRSEALLVRDAATRSVIAIARGGAARLVADGGELDIVAADVPSAPSRRVDVRVRQ